jgi:serine/threonine-protein kinase
MAFQIGQRVGDYEILQMVGAGGMGHVYRVRNIISNRVEAMKVLLPDFAAEPDLAVRFISEIRTLASFDHPNIALLHTAFQSGNQLVMMMEFVEGFTLEQRAQQGSMSSSEVVQIISQTLSALSYAHARGVVHRDIKPANIMVTSHGISKLMDFGIAKSKVDKNLTAPGSTIGSLFYMSPEQVRGATIDARSDLYSIGIVLYELIAGFRPFEGDSTFGILNQQLNVQPRPPIELNPAIPSGLNDIILTALAKDPAMRFQSADAFRNELRGYALPAVSAGVENRQPVPIVASALSAPPVPLPSAVPLVAADQPAAASTKPASPRREGNKVLWIATGALAAVLALVAIATTVPNYRHTHAAAPASVDSSPPSPAASSQPVDAETASRPASPATSDPLHTPSNDGTLVPSAPRPLEPAAAPVGKRQAPTRPPVDAVNGSNQLGVSGNASATANSTVPSPATNNADLALLQEQLIQLNARSAAARRSVQQIRSQQEQMGLGLRGDVEATESRLDAYLRTATNDLRSGNTSAASRDMEKADTELGSLEKFLGH